MVLVSSRTRSASSLPLARPPRTSGARLRPAPYRVRRRERFFFAAPAHAFHGPPHGRATQGRPAGRHQSRPHIIQRRVGLLAQADEQLRPARRVQPRRGTAARRQGRERTRRALATQELIHKSDGNTEPGGHLVNPGPRFAASGHHAFPQIGRIRFHLEKYINLCTRTWKLL